MKLTTVAALLTVAMVSVGAAAQPVEKRAVDNPQLSPPSQLSRAIAVRGGRTLYIGGQVSSTGMQPWSKTETKPTADAAVIGRGDFSAQAEVVFKRIEVLLKQAGGSFDDVVKLTMYLTDMRNYQTLREIRNRYTTGTVPPVMTVVGVKELSHPDFLLEIEAIAVIPDPG
jgi:enamine deaminase RidA (YjgF/YER057c/UK114 family)